MKKLVINGGRKLDGSVMLQGSKNSALPILAATVAVGGTSVIHNCPDLTDISATLTILRHLGCRTKREGHTVIVDASGADRFDIPENLMREMRSSIVFLGALLAGFGRGSVTPPGGCEIGLRPIDLHLSSLKRMGVSVEEKNGRLECVAKNGIKGGRINLTFPSVGATENIILAAVRAKNETVITNAAREPEIVDLADFLNRCGAKIKGAGQSVIHISPVKKLVPAEHTIIPDRIVASTFMASAATAGGRVAVNGIVRGHLDSVISVFENAGCGISVSGRELVIRSDRRLSGIRYLKTMPYPGFPTDSQAIVMAMLAKADGTSVVAEKIFENRFRHVPELAKMGADIRIENGRVAVVRGVEKLHGADVAATDLRGGCALAVAALGADGKTTIGNVFHIDRGCENFENSLAQLGADVKRLLG